MHGEPPKAKPPKDDPLAEMSFLDHLEELRWSILKGMIGIGVGIVIAIVFQNFIVDTLLLGPARGDFFTYRWLGIDAVDLTLQSRRLPGQFFAFWGTLIVIGVIIGAPLFIYQLWKFIAPAFEKSEKKKTFAGSFFITFFFMLGVSFGYLILVPTALQFFTQFNLSDMVRNDFDINAYFSSLAAWVLSCGIVFELPVISYFLSRIGFLTPDLLKTYRRHAIVLCFLIAAFLTPPDPVSQMLLAIPLLLLYQFGIFVSRIGMRRHEKEIWGDEDVADI